MLKIFILLMLHCGVVYAEPSSVHSSPAEIHAAAVTAFESGKVLRVRNALHKLVVDHPEYKPEEVHALLADVEIAQILSEPKESGTTEVAVKKGDSLDKLARRHGTTVDVIKILNRLKNDTIYAGQTLRVWNAPLMIYVDKSQNTLLLKSGEEILKAYPVATGADNLTPVGTFTVANKLIDPVWYHEGAVFEPGSPDNALGTRWLGFDKKGYGIHGTIYPESIGYQMSAGCVRMRNSDVEQLFRIVPAGTKVTIVN